MNSQRFLYQHIKGKFPELGKIRDAQEFTPKAIQKWVVDNESHLTTHLDFKHMTSEQLVHVTQSHYEPGLQVLRHGVRAWHLHHHENCQATSKFTSVHL
jgi:hypothetical protein